MNDPITVISTAWPIFVGLIMLVVILAKMHAEIDTLKENVKDLFDLWNKK